MSRQFLAYDLGADSGRAMLARLTSGVIEVREIHRFPTHTVTQNGSLRWDIARIWHHIREALDRVGDVPLESIGVDTWGVDYGLLDGRGNLLGNPYHYRDSRTDGIMSAVFSRISRDRIYAVTGIQFLPINTLFQLYAASRATPADVETARALATIPDLLNYWLTGRLSSEYTIATTTQMVDARTRRWAEPLLEAIGLPTRLLQPIVEPGTTVGPLLDSVSARFHGTPVVAPACHDTASAVAAVDTGSSGAFLSSGTWSLLGAELAAPVITPDALALNFTNEGGVAGTTRLLKNITGLWLLQACRRCWSDEGRAVDYDALLEAMVADGQAFRSLVDPDHRDFVRPADMPRSIAAYCRRTGQPEPDVPPAFARTILESLAFKYRAVVESLESLIGSRVDTIRVVGGGARNRVLTQWTANATGRAVIAGPAEATALGNVALQMVATGAVSSVAEARAAVERSFPVERFEPVDTERWDDHYQRFRGYLEFSCA